MQDLHRCYGETLAHHLPFRAVFENADLDADRLARLVDLKLPAMLVTAVCMRSVADISKSQLIPLSKDEVKTDHFT